MCNFTQLNQQKQKKMKKITSILAALLIITSAQSQNMSNLHQVCTTVSTKAIYVSPTGKIFYATNGSMDKRIVAFDPTTNTKMTADTGKSYFCIEGTGSNVYVGSSTHAIKFTNSGSFVNQISCTTLGLTPANAGIWAIASNTSGVYFGGNFDNVVKTNFNLVKQTKFTPAMGNGGHVTSLTFKADTLLMGMDPNNWGNFYYSAADDSVNYGLNTCFFNTSTKINAVAVWHNGIYASRDNDAFYVRDSGFCGFATLPSINILTLQQLGTKLWAGTAQGELMNIFGNNGNYDITSTLYNMHTTALNNVDSIFDIASDANGELWIATNKGVYTTAVVTVTTSIDNIEKLEGITFYPNPNSGTFNINSNVDGTLKIYNISGQNIISVHINSGISVIQSIQTPGCYFVNVETKNGHSDMKKMIVQ